MNEAETSKKLTTGVLKKGESKTFELRLWMDEDTPAISESMNANFQSKITIIAVQKEGIPEVSIIASEKEDGITVDISTVENPKNETLTYFYQLNEEEEIESENNTHTFTGLSDGKYKVSVRAETLDGIILEEKELEVTIAYESVYVSSSGNNETGNGSLESPYATLQPAYSKVKSGGNILLLSDIIATSTTNMNIENKNVTLRSDGENIYTIIKDPNFTTQVLEINNSNTITTTNIIFDGNQVNSTRSLVAVTNSVLNLNSNTKIRNNFIVNNEEGGGILVYGSHSILNISGAEITNNKANQGGGIKAGETAVVNFNEGIISENQALSGVGGGIFLWQSNLNMNGGTIENNQAKQGGGIGVSASSTNSSITINNGIIRNNTATSGGGIWASRYHSNPVQVTVYVKSGTISGNIAPTGANTYATNGAQIIDQR